MAVHPSNPKHQKSRFGTPGSFLYQNGYWIAVKCYCMSNASIYITLSAHMLDLKYTTSDGKQLLFF